MSDLIIIARPKSAPVEPSHPTGGGLIALVSKAKAVEPVAKDMPDPATTDSMTPTCHKCMKSDEVFPVTDPDVTGDADPDYVCSRCKCYVPAKSTKTIDPEPEPAVEPTVETPAEAPPTPAPATEANAGEATK